MDLNMADVNARERGIRAALARLGETADDMAESLRAAGIKGIRENGEACPLANYLRREGFDDINVTHSVIEDAAALTYADEGRWHMETPRAASAFIRQFDDVIGGAYADLADEDDGS